MSKKFSVEMPVYASLTMQVEMPDDYDPEDDCYDAVFDAAYDVAPRSVCAQCSGWNREWSFEDGLDSAEANAIYNSEGEKVWNG